MSNSGISSRHLLLTALLALPFLILGGQSAPVKAAQTAEAIFAGGCFWCMEQAFEELSGVVDAVSGYIGGNVPNPTYAAVSAGTTGHAEAIKVTYDPGKISYQQLLASFWRNIDPLDSGGQFCDRGSQYRSEIFALDQQQQELATRSRQQINDSGAFNIPVVTGISIASTFYPAEQYHQNYYRENPTRYKFYKWNCGRQQRLDSIWHSVKQLPFEATNQPSTQTD